MENPPQDQENLIYTLEPTETVSEYKNLVLSDVSQTQEQYQFTHQNKPVASTLPMKLREGEQREGLIHIDPGIEPKLNLHNGLPSSYQEMSERVEEAAYVARELEEKGYEIGQPGEAGTALSGTTIESESDLEKLLSDINEL